MRITIYDHFTLDWSTQSGSHFRKTNIRTVPFLVADFKTHVNEVGSID